MRLKNVRKKNSKTSTLKILKILRILNTNLKTTTKAIKRETLKIILIKIILIVFSWTKNHVYFDKFNKNIKLFFNRKTISNTINLITTFIIVLIKKKNDIEELDFSFKKKLNLIFFI